MMVLILLVGLGTVAAIGYTVRELRKSVAALGEASRLEEELSDLQ